MNTTRNNTRSISLMFAASLLMLVTTSCFAQTAPVENKLAPPAEASSDCNSSANTTLPPSEWQGSDLHKAVIELNTAAVKKLLKKNSDVNEKDNFGNTPLHNALARKIPEPIIKPRETMLSRAQKEGKMQTEIARLLINHGADVNAKGFDGKTALIKAVILDESAAFQIINLLIQNKANVNVQDNQGYTALMEAARTDRIKMIEFLLQNKADKNLKTCDGKTARSLAEDFNFMKVVKVLE